MLFPKKQISEEIPQNSTDSLEVDIVNDPILETQGHGFIQPLEVSANKRNLKLIKSEDSNLTLLFSTQESRGGVGELQ